MGSTINRLVADKPLIADLHPDRIEEYQRVAGIKRATLPFSNRLKHSVRHRRDQVRWDINALKLLQMSADLAHRHAACIH